MSSFNATTTHPFRLHSFSTPLLSLLLTTFFLVYPAQANEPVSFEIAAAPSWVLPITPPTGNQNSPDTIEGGIDFLLLDNQENFATKSVYYHQARQILTDQGVQDGSDISVSFDPTYQKLTFHYIRVSRAGTPAPTDHLDRKHFQILRRETEMEYFLLDGRYTAQCVLEDVRVGDIIEYAYTIDGANPVMAGKNSAIYYTTWRVPVGHIVVRFLYPQNHPIHFQATNKNITPKITSTNGLTEWFWEEHNVAPRQQDPSTPADYDPYSRIEASDFLSWNEVVEWALPFYTPIKTLSPNLNAEVQKLRDIIDADRRILAAMAFVQDEIRYLSVSSSIHSHQPSAPEEVLRRRFGDCKDKTLLCATLLEHCGISVSPVLVSSSNRSTVIDMLPSPYAFDHVILQVETPRNTYWLDVTGSNQRGPLDQVYISNFGQGLVITPGKSLLTAFKAPATSIPKTTIQENYIIREPGQNSLLDVTTIYHGAAADSTRSNFKNESRATLQKNYLKYYFPKFPEITARQPLKITELPDQNACKVEEQYTLTNIWKLNEKENTYTLSISSSELLSQLGDPIALPREDPVAWHHPAKLSHEINLQFFQPWEIEGESTHATSDAFQFDHSTKVKASTITLNYQYQTLADRVLANKIPAHNQAVEKATGALGYTFTYRTPEQQTLTLANQPNNPNWLILLCSALIFVASIIGCIVIYKCTAKVPPLLPSIENAAYEGLSGWLVIVGLQTIARPISLIAYMVPLFAIFDQTRWNALTHPSSTQYHPMWMPVLLFEWTFNLLALVFSTMLIIMYFKKRAFFRTGTIIILAASVLGLSIDYLISEDLLSVVSPETPDDVMSDIMRTIVASSIWIPYMLISKRAKATFRH